ncbi:hypothetical protein ACVXG7_10640 [Enterobacter hormaechei]
MIHEALINPIRSVTVIDDEYPTFTKLLSKEAESASSSTGLAHPQQSPEQHSFKPENIERLKNIIELCHFKKSGALMFMTESPLR